MYKNGRRLGVMIGQLQGDYVWAVVCHHPIAIDKGGVCEDRSEDTTVTGL